MKKLFITLLVAPLLFASCNKKLKEDIKELDGQVNDLKSKNEALQNQINGVSSILGSNEPITATTSFLDDNGNSITWTDTYNFKSGNYETQYMEENNDGTYTIYIERFSDVEWYEGAWASFTYNPTTGGITDKRGGQYWDWNRSFNSYAYYYDNTTGCTINITLSSISTSTGDISLSFTATGNDTYATNTNYLPNDNEGATTTFSFTGKLKVFPKD